MVFIHANLMHVFKMFSQISGTPYLLWKFGEKRQLICQYLWYPSPKQTAEINTYDCASAIFKINSKHIHFATNQLLPYIVISQLTISQGQKAIHSFLRQ